MRRDPNRPIVLQQAETVDLEKVDAVFIRSDPPFNNEYLWGTLILERLRGKTVVINDPRGLREANEKLYACHFPRLMPGTLVSNDAQRIGSFVERMQGKAVIKPIDGAGGEGVMVLSRDDLNLNAIIENATRHGRRQVMVQQYLPQVAQGDKRILLLDGEPLGAISRIARPGELRSNIHVGGRVVASTLDQADRHIVETIRAKLREDGLYFVGLDVIGGKLTEINVTSPTGIQQMSRLNDENLSARVIDWVQDRVSSA
jgi:glutathione synthase